MLHHNSFTVSRHAARYFGMHPKMATSTGGKEIYEAYFEFAFLRTAHDAALYEMAASTALIGEVKRMFFNLARGKKEVLNILRSNRPVADLLNYAAQTEKSLVRDDRSIIDTELSPEVTPIEAFAFAFRNENKTLATYKELEDTITIPSVKILTTYLRKAQMDHLRLLTTQLAPLPYGATREVNSDSNPKIKKFGRFPNSTMVKGGNSGRKRMHSRIAA
jgi:rubrerythrin